MVPEAEIQLHEVKPREIAGRDTIARFNVQFRAAALECLKILDRSVNRVYCDVHDDYVSSRTSDGLTTYRFYQVKTKDTRNYRWSRNDLMGISKVRKKSKGKSDADLCIDDAAGQEKVKNSFIGNMLLHTINFGDACESVAFQTNVGLDDDVEAFVADLESEKFEHVASLLLSNSLNGVFNVSPPLSKERVDSSLRKLRIEPGLSYLAIEDADFEARAYNAIWTYSEIPLTYPESAEIARNVLELVQRKSKARLPKNLTAEALDSAASIQIDDLLDILSISKAAYYELVAHNDPKALRSVSIIQRKMRRANLSEAMVESASRWKVEWDDWYRTHSRYDLELSFLLEKLRSIYARWSRSEVSFSGLQVEVEELAKEVSNTKMGATLTPSLLLGGVFALLVKGESL